MLLKNADTAMYRAKERGRSCFETYSVEMNSAAEARLALEGDLHQALNSGQLRVVYQPQIDLVTGRVIGVEALARWDHPTLGPIGPDTFIPLAEESGLIVDLDDWVMRQACTQARAWADAGLPPVRMAVNLSGRGFWRARVVERVHEALLLTGVNPEQVELEVTESMAVEAVADTRLLFRELEALGVRLAIDDFGTGYSALGRLQGLPFHTLKIDRSFVHGVENPHDEAPIVAAMIAMAHALKLEVVAEGVGPRRSSRSSPATAATWARASSSAARSKPTRSRSSSAPNRSSSPDPTPPGRAVRPCDGAVSPSGAGLGRRAFRRCCPAAAWRRSAPPRRRRR